MNKPLTAYLTKAVTIKNPFDGKLVTIQSDTRIKIDPITQIAWIKQFQIELERTQYSIIC